MPEQGKALRNGHIQKMIKYIIIINIYLPPHLSRVYYVVVRRSCCKEIDLHITLKSMHMSASIKFGDS